MEPWYESKLFTACISSVVSIMVFIFGQIFSRKLQKKNDKKNIIILITQNNSYLFSLIYRGSLSEYDIEYVKLREELIKSNVIFILPADLKEKFRELYIIHFSNPELYEKQKKNIHKILKEIVEILNRYGVDSFEY